MNLALHTFKAAEIPDYSLRGVVGGPGSCLSIVLLEGLDGDLIARFALIDIEGYCVKVFEEDTLEINSITKDLLYLFGRKTIGGLRCCTVPRAALEIEAVQRVEDQPISFEAALDEF
jgi:hypothetical protein